MARSTSRQGEAQDAQSTTHDDRPDRSHNNTDPEGPESGAQATEGTPLLATDLPKDVLPNAAVKYKVILMCAIFLFIIDVGAFVMDPPTQQLMEDVICRDHFPDHPVGRDGVGDGRCKTASIQKSLAALKSMTMFAQMLCRKLHYLPSGSSQLTSGSVTCTGAVWPVR